MIKIIKTPKSFKAKKQLTYPPNQGNDIMIEEYFYNYILSGSKNFKFNSRFYYLPIFWTNYFHKKNYGKKIKFLRFFINTINFFYINKTKFTIVQYAGGIKAPLNNSIIFASAGKELSPLGRGSVYIPIPLISKPFQYKKKANKLYKASFIGRNTHPVRLKLLEQFKDNDNFKIDIVEDINNVNKFNNYLENSIFTLCPRGTSPTSFRLYESISSGSIPIYISDIFWLPFEDEINWEEICVFIKPDEIDKIESIIDELVISNKFDEMITKGQKVYKDYFTYEKICEHIIKILNNYE